MGRCRDWHDRRRARLARTSRRHRRTESIADGNQTGLTWPGGCLYQYDSLNRLTHQGGGPESFYSYDGLGRRVRSQSVGGADGTRYYVFDGDLLIGEVVADGAAYYAAVAYTWGADGLVSERFLGTGAYSLWYHFGPQGETRYLTAADNSVADTYLYTAYGTPIPLTAPDRNPFRYDGQFGYYTDPGGPAGIMLCGARWYNPYTARWMTRDPIGYDGGENLYGYCDQDPVGFADPSGLLSLDEAIDIGISNTFTGAGTIAGFFMGGGGGLVAGSVVPGADNAAGAVAGSLYGAAAGSVAGWAAGQLVVGWRHSMGTWFSRSDGGSSNGGSGSSGSVGGSGACSPRQPRFVRGRWFEHFSKHRGEFAELENSVEYLNRARQVISGRAPGLMQHVTRDGRTLYNNRLTVEFVSRKGDTIKTLFKPKHGMAYWLEQLAK